MDNLIKQAKDDAEAKRYLHDDFADKKKPSRQFLVNIIGTIYPGFFKELIETQTNARFEKQTAAESGDHILVADEWINALQEHPFESKKKGKFLSFLVSSTFSINNINLLAESKSKAKTAKSKKDRVRA